LREKIRTWRTGEKEVAPKTFRGFYTIDHGVGLPGDEATAEKSKKVGGKKKRIFEDRGQNTHEGRKKRGPGGKRGTCKT